MKRIFMAAAVAAVLLPGPVRADDAADAWTGNANLFLGGKRLRDDFWSPAEKEGELGVELDLRQLDWPVSFALDLLGARGQGDGPAGTTIKSRTREADLGVRKVWDGWPHVRPFLGGGLSLQRAEIEVDSPAGDVTDAKGVLGLWLAGGVYWTLKDAFNIGLEVRSSGAKVKLNDISTNTRAGHLGLILGYHW